MKEKLNLKELIYIGSMLFGMFFGAGNLIFPVHMGQLAGRNIIPAIIGFLITGVGLPLLGVAALGISRSEGLHDLSGKVGRPYSYFFTCALYLTIGPFFAIPRCATVPFTVGVTAIIGNDHASAALAIFSFVFFTVVLAFSLWPGKILIWIGKILNPLFLVFLGIMVIRALISPMGDISAIEPSGGYAAQPFFTGFLDGYNTMDALAGLAFGIVVVNVIRGLGIDKPEGVAASTVKSGILSCAIMALIYIAVTVVGTQTRGIYDICENGGEVLALIAEHYFGRAGALVLAGTVTFACLKTAVGLITSCSETFEKMFPKGPSYRVWAIIFCAVSFLIANLGLSTIIEYSVPVLMFLYPLAITLILLALCGKLFGNDRIVYALVTGFTLVAAVFDFIAALPKSVVAAAHLDVVIEFMKSYMPLFKLGLGWVIPAAVGLVIGLIIHAARKKA